MATSYSTGARGARLGSGYEDKSAQVMGRRMNPSANRRPVDAPRGESSALPPVPTYKRGAMTPTATVASGPDRVAAAEQTAGGWLVWVALISATSVLVGAYWDISWHMSVGRDTFW